MVRLTANFEDALQPWCNTYTEWYSGKKKSVCIIIICLRLSLAKLCQRNDNLVFLLELVLKKWSQELKNPVALQTWEIHLHSFDKDLLGVYHVAGTVRGAGICLVNQMGPPGRIYIPAGARPGGELRAGGEVENAHGRGGWIPRRESGWPSRGR